MGKTGRNTLKNTNTNSELVLLTVFTLVNAVKHNLIPQRLIQISNRLLILLSLTMMPITGCKKTLPTENPYRDGKIEMAMLETACTEALVKIKVSGIPLPVGCIISVNKQNQLPLVLSGADTVIAIDSLSPSSDYQLSFSVNAGNAQVIADSISFRTPDSSSHTIVWQGYEFGASYGSTSVLNDVGILDDNTIWAVGGVYQFDSSQMKLKMYNLLKWNGSNWLKEFVPFYNSRGDTFQVVINAISVFDKNNIIIGSSGVYRWDGKRFSEIPIPEDVFFAWIYKIWGLSTENFYIGGEYGAIAHYYKGEWKKIESGTELDIVGMSGYYDAAKQETVVYCVASVYGGDHPHKIIRIVNDKPETYNSEGIKTYHLNAIHMFKQGKIYSGWGGVYTFNENLTQNIWVKNNDVTTPYGIMDIDGNNERDMFYCGAYGDIGHFNGVSWTNYIQSGQLPVQYMVLNNITTKGKIACAVGYYSKPGTPGVGYAYIGKR